MTPWQVDQSPALPPLSKASPGENGQRQQGWEQSVSPFFQESGKDWNLECHFEVGTCTTRRFKTVVGLSSSPRLSPPPGLAHTQDSCSCFLEEA